MENKKELSTKETIRNVAIDLFAAKGFREVPVREIAKEVGIKASSLYKHYENKEAILESIFALFKQKMGRTVIPEEALKQYVLSVTPEQYFNESFDIFRQVMWAPDIIKISKIINIEQQRNESVREFFLQELIEKPMKTLKYVLDLMIENGLIEPIDTGMAAEEYDAYVIYLYFELNFLKDSPDPMEIEKRMKRHNAFFANHVLKKRESK